MLSIPDFTPEIDVSFGNIKDIRTLNESVTTDCEAEATPDTAEPAALQPTPPAPKGKKLCEVCGRVFKLHVHLARHMSHSHRWKRRVRLVPQPKVEPNAVVDMTLPKKRPGPGRPRKTEQRSLPPKPIIVKEGRFCKFQIWKCRSNIQGAFFMLNPLPLKM